MLSKNPRRKTPRLCVTRLEDRALPASSITVIFGTNGAGSLDAFLFEATPGVIAAADGGGVPGTLSIGALRALDSTTNISVTSTNGITFNDSVGTLTLQTGSGHSVTFDSGAGSLLFAFAGDTLTSGGASLTLIAGTSLTACNLNSAGGDVSLTATTSAAGTLTARSILTGGTGNISLQTTRGGAGSGVITQTGTAAGRTVTVAAAGSVTVDAVQGTNVSLGTTNGSINSSGGNAIQSSGPLTLSATTGIAVNTLAASIQAGNSTSGDISIRQVASPARALTTAGTGVRNQSLAGSVAISNAGDAITVAAGAPVQTANGAISLAGLDLNIAGTVDSGTGRTTLANSTAGESIDLGTNAAGSVGLTQAELNNVTTVALQIGSPTAGSIVVSAAVAAPIGWSTLTLVSGGAITGASTSLTVPNLCINSPGPVTLTGANKVGTLAAAMTGPLTFVQTTNPLVIGSVDGTAGINAFGADVTITANALDVQQAINAGAGTVTIQAFGTDIRLGGADTAGTLSLNDVELGRITAGVLRVGSTLTPLTTIAGAITRHAGYRTLSLVSGGTISQSAALSVANLAVQAADNVSLVNAGNDLDTLAAQLTGNGSAFSYVDANAVAIGTVDLVPGIVVSGPVTLTAGTAITDGNGVAVNVSAGSLTATAATGIDLDVVVTTLTAGLTGNGPITLSQGTVAAATVTSLNAGTGTITLDGGTFNLGNNNVIAAASSLNLDGLATLNLGGFNSSVGGVRLTNGAIVGTGTLTSATAFDVRAGLIGVPLGGGVGLTKTTPGGVLLIGSNTYIGPTTINGGTLQINGNQATGSSVTVNPGGSLGGTGTVAASVMVGAGGALAPGAGLGIINTGDLQLAAGATFTVAMNGPYDTAGTHYGRANVTGAVALNSATLNLVGGAVAATPGKVLTIIANDGTDAVSGTFAGLPQGSMVIIGSVAATISYTGGDGNDVTLTTVGVADLGVAKTGPGTVVAGTAVTYTITVTNNGPQAADNVALSQPLPSPFSATFTQTAGPAFTLGTSGAFTATAASLAAGASATFRMVVSVTANATGTLSSTAGVTTSTPELTVANNTSTTTANITASADLQVTTTGPATIVAGNLISYTITVANAGPSDAQNISLADAVPANATFVASKQTTGILFGVTDPPVGGTGTTTFTIAGLEAGASATFVIVDRVNAGTPGGTVVRNLASVTAGTADPNPPNSSAVSDSAVAAGITVESLTVDDGTAQRSMVRSLTVTFSGPLNLVGRPASAFRLTRTGGGDVTLAVDLSGSTAAKTVARLTFSGPLTEGANSLVDGTYTLTLSSAPLQGALQDGDVTLGGVFRLFGDVNGDRAVNGLDLAAFRNAFGTVSTDANYVPYLDFNGDGVINGSDLTQFRSRFGVILP